MKHQIATDPSQSARPIACGVSYKTADMTLSYNNGYYELMATPFHYGCFDEKDTPAWSLSALLTSVLPKHLDDFPLTKWRPPFLEDEIWEMDNEGVLNGDVKLYFSETKWIVDYDWDGFSGTLPQSENPIEAIVLAIELLHANGYKLNEINQ